MFCRNIEEEVDSLRMEVADERRAGVSRKLWVWVGGKSGWAGRGGGGEGEGRSGPLFRGDYFH